MENVKRLCMHADIVASQETWLLQHDLKLLGDVDDNFEYTAKTAVDLSSGVLRGRPHGGVALLWRKSVFPRVTVVKCNSERIAAIRMEDEDGRAMIVMSVYMPTDHMDNLPLFCQCLGEMTAIIQDNNIEVVYMLGDYNAHPNAPFGIEFCDENDWIYADLELADAYKSVEQFREQYKKVGNESFSPSDTLVGRAMDFVYSNQTFMNLIARELWNVGSRAIDKIVEIRGQGGNKMEHNTKYTK